MVTDEPSGKKNRSIEPKAILAFSECLMRDVHFAC